MSEEVSIGDIDFYRSLDVKYERLQRKVIKIKELCNKAKTSDCDYKDFLADDILEILEKE